MCIRDSLHRMTRAQWKDFANRNDISDIWTPTTSDPLYDSEINKPCINSTQEQSSWRCGYVALRGRFWRLEAWGQRILPGDVYRPDTILPVYKDLYPRTRLVGEKFTSIRIGDFWSQTVVNPGYYVRARYGLDCLRHAQHWAVTGLSTSWGQYSTTSTHFEPCPDEGHHLCLNQYLADGNIQFQQPWA